MTINSTKFFSLVLIVLSFSLFWGSNQLNQISFFNKKLLALAIILLILHREVRTNVSLKSILVNLNIISLVAWCFATTLWSYKPFITFYESITQLMIVAFAIFFTRAYTLRDSFNAFRLVFLLIAIINIFYIFLFFSKAYSADGLRGVFSHKNHLGYFSALGAIIWSYFYLKYKSTRNLVASLLFICLLYASQSKTSLWLFIIAMTVFFLIPFSNDFYRVKRYFADSSHLKIIKLSTFFVLSLVLTLIVLNIDFLTSWLIDSLDEQFLTGRGQLWKVMLLALEEKLVYGTGYSAVWFGNQDSIIYSTKLFETDPIWVESLATSDSGYIDVLLSLGVIGLFLIVTMILKTLYKLILLARFSIDMRVLLAIFIFVVFHNVSETTFLLSINPLWVLFVIIIITTNEIKLS